MFKWIVASIARVKEDALLPEFSIWHAESRLLEFLFIKKAFFE